MMDTIIKVAVLTVLIYIIAGCVRFLCMRQDVLEYILRNVNETYARAHPDGSRRLPQELRQYLLMFYVVFAWTTTFGIKIPPRGANDNGDSSSS